MGFVIKVCLILSSYFYRFFSVFTSLFLWFSSLSHFHPYFPKLPIYSFPLSPFFPFFLYTVNLYTSLSFFHSLFPKSLSFFIFLNFLYLFISCTALPLYSISIFSLSPLSLSLPLFIPAVSPVSLYISRFLSSYISLSPISLF